MRGATVDGEAGGLLELSSPSVSSPCLQCAPGYQGQNCSKEQDACQSQPCHNHGTCTPRPGGFHCACPPGFVGLRCEGDVDECLDRPCHPTGTAVCHSLANAFYCQCLPGHTGEAWGLWGTAKTGNTQTVPRPLPPHLSPEKVPQHPLAHIVCAEPTVRSKSRQRQ